MALNHPVDPPPHHDRPHPCVCLIAGFGVILAGVTIVHIVFNVLV